MKGPVPGTFVGSTHQDRPSFRLDILLDSSAFHYSATAGSVGSGTWLVIGGTVRR